MVLENNEPHLIVLYCKDAQRTYHTVPDETALCGLMLTLCEAELATQRGWSPSVAFVSEGAVPTTGAKMVQYDAADLFNFIDGRLLELVVMKFDVTEGRYDPQGREWLKNRLYQQLATAANADERSTLV